MQVDILDYDDYRILRYHNNNVTYRILTLDLYKNIIQDELFEYNNNGKLLANIIFAPDYLTVIAKREHTENQGFKDYRRINNELVLTQICVHEWLSKRKLKSNYYNADNQLIYYDIYEEENSEIGMICMGHFNANGEQFSWDNPPDKVKLLLPYSDY